MLNSYLLRISVVWLLLVAATILSFAIKWLVDMGNGLGNMSAVIPILAITFVKVRFVILDFMELRDAPFILRLVNESWVVLLGAMLIFTFW